MFRYVFLRILAVCGFISIVVQLAPPDNILGLTESFNADYHASKINLGVGAYRGEDGKPFILESVRRAELDLLQANLDHEYAGIQGIQSFLDKSIEFAYGSDCDVVKNGKVAAVQVKERHLLHSIAMATSHYSHVSGFVWNRSL